MATDFRRQTKQRPQDHQQQQPQPQQQQPQLSQQPQAPTNQAPQTHLQHSQAPPTQPLPPQPHHYSGVGPQYNIMYSQPMPHQAMYNANFGSIYQDTHYSPYPAPYHMPVASQAPPVVQPNKAALTPNSHPASDQTRQNNIHQSKYVPTYEKKTKAPAILKDPNTQKVIDWKTITNNTNPKGQQNDNVTSESSSNIPPPTTATSNNDDSAARKLLLHVSGTEDKKESSKTTQNDNATVETTSDETKPCINDNNINNIVATAPTAAACPAAVAPVDNEVTIESGDIKETSVETEDQDSGNLTCENPEPSKESEDGNSDSLTHDNPKPSSNTEDGNSNSLPHDNTEPSTETEESKSLTYDSPEQYNPVTNTKGKRKYSKRFLLEVCEKVCKLKSYDPDDKIARDGNRSGALPSEKVDYFAPSFSSNQRYSNSNRQNDPRRQNQNSFANRSNLPNAEKPRKILPVAPVEVELKTAANPWKRVVDENIQAEDVDVQVIKRKFRGILNKLTPQNLDSLANAVTDLQIKTESLLEDVIDIVFAKALAEPGFCELYGKICSVLRKNTVDSTNFYSLLLKRCQIQFQSDIYAGLNITERQEAVDKEENAEKKKALEEELFEDMFKCRQRGLGLIKFIGELYKIGMLNKEIMFECIQRLLSECSEESLECLCDLLATVGEKLDQECKDAIEKNKKAAKTNVKPKSNQQNQIGYAAAAASNPNKTTDQPPPAQISLDPVFDGLHRIRKSKEMDLSSRIKFKILDTCDLREKQRWKSRSTKETNLQKIEDIHKEAHEKKLEQERKFAKRQDGKKGFGHSGSSNQISSMIGGEQRRNLHTSASSHMLRDNSTIENIKANQSEVEKEHATNKEKMKSFMNFSTLGEHNLANDSVLKPMWLTKGASATGRANNN